MAIRSNYYNQEEGMQQIITVLASPEEALFVSSYVERHAMIDAIIAINERTTAICDLLVGSINQNYFKNQLLCNITWQLQANLDCLTLFIKRYFTKQLELCSELVQAAREKASQIIMSFSAVSQVVRSLNEVIRPLLDIKQYINAVVAIAHYQRELE